MKITLPWPDRRLSPNARKHWRQVAAVKKQAREIAAIETLSQTARECRYAAASGEGRIPVRIAFYPPDNRRRDDDNMVASFKAFRDGIADALQVDDRRFKPHYFFEDAQKPGFVEVEILSKNPVSNPVAGIRRPVTGLSPDETEAA